MENMKDIMYMTYLESSANLTYESLDHGRKPELPHRKPTAGQQVKTHNSLWSLQMLQTHSVWFQAVVIELMHVCVYLHIILRDLYLRRVDVVNQQAQSPAIHLLYPHSFCPTFCHLAC